MEILHVIVGLEAGGAERALQRLVQSYAASPSCRHTVLSLTGLGAIGKQLELAGVPVLALGLRSPLDVFRGLWRLRQVVRARKPDIVQTWMYHADFLGGLATRMAGRTPVIWGVRTTDAPTNGSAPTAALRWLCARLSGWLPDAIVCAAEASRRAHAQIGYCQHKMVVIANGYDFSRFAVSSEERRSSRKQFGIDDDALVIGSLGRFHADKDPDNFVRMAELLVQRQPQLRFLMVGRGLDGHNERLQSAIATAGLTTRFILAGERADVPQCLAAMDVFCLHSRNEGFPNVLAEAMAMGLPCVTTDVGDAAILIADADLVVPRDSATELAQAVERLILLEPDARAALGASSKARVESEYSIATMHARYDATYRRLLAGAPR